MIKFLLFLILSSTLFRTEDNLKASSSACGWVFYRLKHGNLDPNNLPALRKKLAQLALTTETSLKGKTFEVINLLGILELHPTQKSALWKHYVKYLNRTDKDFSSVEYIGENQEIIFVGTEGEGIVINKSGEVFIFYIDADASSHLNESGQIRTNELNLKPVLNIAIKQYNLFD